jgi:predicted ArsR family transcriptional regulator
MSETKVDTRFFESTKGQIVTLLRTATMTVNELAEKLKLTDNAIRAHLMSLERDHLVEQKGVIKGFRKPHNIYGLTDEARHLFPKPYAFLFNKLVEVLKRALSPSTMETTLRGVGREIGQEASSGGPQDLDSRLNYALETLEGLGGAATIVKQNGAVMIKSESCPFNEVVSEHPEVCKVAESMLEEIVGTEVKEICDRSASPKCCFKIGADEMT